MLQKEFAHDVEDVVYFIGQGKIYQAKVCETRFVRKLVKSNNKDVTSYYSKNFEVYRLYINDREGDVTNVLAKSCYYDGNYAFNSWFTADELFDSVEDALIYLRTNVKMLPYQKQEINTI
jgi:hypothetical protein